MDTLSISSGSTITTVIFDFKGLFIERDDLDDLRLDLPSSCFSPFSERVERLLEVL
jgi:hypothetical protein